MWDEMLTPMEEDTEAVHTWAVAEVENDGIAPTTHQALGTARASLISWRRELRWS